MDEVKFTLIAISVCIVGYHLKQHFRIGLLPFVATSILSFGYYMTYLECNRKLKVDRILSERRYVASWSSKVHNAFTWFHGDNSAEKYYEKGLRNAIKVDLPYCRPDVVLMMYLNEFLFKYITAVLETYMAVASQLKNDLSFPLNVLMPLVVVVMFCFLINLLFKYILTPSAWAPLIAISQSHNERTCHQAIKSRSTRRRRTTRSIRSIDISNEDELTESNLKAFITQQLSATVTNLLQIENSKIEEVEFDTNATPLESLKCQEKVSKALISSKEAITPKTIKIRKFESANLKGRNKNFKKLIIDNCAHTETRSAAAGGAVKKNKIIDETEIEEVDLNDNQSSQEEAQSTEDNFIDVDNLVDLALDTDFELIRHIDFD